MSVNTTTTTTLVRLHILLVHYQTCIDAPHLPRTAPSWHAIFLLDRNPLGAIHKVHTQVGGRGGGSRQKRTGGRGGSNLASTYAVPVSAIIYVHALKRIKSYK